MNYCFYYTIFLNSGNFFFLARGPGGLNFRGKSGGFRVKTRGGCVPYFSHTFTPLEGLPREGKDAILFTPSMPYFSPYCPP